MRALSHEDRSFRSAAGCLLHRPLGARSLAEGQEKIDTAVLRPDGARIKEARELKRWLVQDIDISTQNFAEKLLTYATGRVPNHAERAEIRHIVAETRHHNAGARDLLLALIASQTFRTR